MSIIIKKEDLRYFVREIIKKRIREWKSMDNKPRSVAEEPMRTLDVANVMTKAQTQVSNDNLPIEDNDWIPGNSSELKTALSQIGEEVPESEIEDFYLKVKRFFDMSIDDYDNSRQ